MRDKRCRGPDCNRIIERTRHRNTRYCARCRTAAIRETKRRTWNRRKHHYRRIDNV